MKKESTTSHGTKEQTTKEQTSSEHFQENFSKAFNWFSESSQNFGETYKKQLNYSFDIYKKFYETSLGLGKNTLEFDSKGFDFLQKNMEMYIKNIEIYSNLSKEILESTINSMKKNNGFIVINEDFVDAIYHAFNHQAKNMININQNFIESLNDSGKSFNVNLASVSQKLQKKMEENFETSRSTFKSFLDSYSKLNNAAFTSDTHFIEEINKQIDLITKGNMKFWSEMYKNITTEKEK